MTNAELIQKIRNEIERHLNSAIEHQNANPDMPKYRWYLYEGAKELCTDLLCYIDDTLEESERPEPYNPVYDEAYLNEKIKKATESWKGVDVDAMLAECRGYDEEKSEKPMNPDDAMKELDEKIALVKQRGTWDGVDVDKYIDEVRGREPENPVPKDLEEAAKEYCPDDAYPFGPDIINKEVRKAFIAGYNLCKEQMLKEAVEGEVMTNGFYPYEPRIVAPYPNCPYDFGDKVRVIVIKEN